MEGNFIHGSLMKNSVNQVWTGMEYLRLEKITELYSCSCHTKEWSSSVSDHQREWPINESITLVSPYRSVRWQKGRLEKLQATDLILRSFLSFSYFCICPSRCGIASKLLLLNECTHIVKLFHHPVGSPS